MINAIAERRQAARTRVLQAGRIREGDGGVATDCRVVNLSLFGALLQVSDAIPLPAFFTLEVRGDAYPAEVRWRRGAQMGVRFFVEETRAAETSALDRARDLREAQIENALLKKREQQLLKRLAELGYDESNEF